MARVPLRVVCAGLLLPGVVSLAPSEQKPIIGEIEDVDKQVPQGLPGKIVLYPGSRMFPTDLKTMSLEVKACLDDGSSKTIDLSPNVCLSGEYYIRNNLKIQETPKCADGTEPTALFYPNRGCTGTPQFSSNETPFTTSECLWSEEQSPVPSYYWSMVFRCDMGTEVNEEVQQAVEPPALVGEVLGPLKGQASFHGGAPFQCHTDFANRSHVSEYGIDNCDWPLSSWGHESLEIRTPPICANGTRAQLALYEDFSGNWRNYKCLESKRMPNMQLLDIGDDMVNSCINIKHKTYPKRAVGIQFHCDGLEYENGNGKAILPEEKPPVPAAAMVSHNVCATSEGNWQWTDAEGQPTFFYPKAETCVTLPKTRQMKPYKNAICPDGNPARIAQWENSACEGWPSTIEDVDRNMYLNCKNWNLKKETSYMFWCGGNGTTPEEKSKDDRRAVLSKNACPKPVRNDGWVSVDAGKGPTFERVDADICMSLYDSSRWKVFSGAECADGSPAEIAFWKGSRCRGKPESITAVDESPLSQCGQLCPDKSWSCSVSFWCNGFDDDMF